MLYVTALPNESFRVQFLLGTLQTFIWPSSSVRNQ